VPSHLSQRLAEKGANCLNDQQVLATILRRESKKPANIETVHFKPMPAFLPIGRPFSVLFQNNPRPITDTFCSKLIVSRNHPYFGN
jgi:hypothetical protein